MATAPRSERITRQVAKLLRAERERTQSSAVQGQPDPFATKSGDSAANAFGDERHRLPRIRRPYGKAGTWKPARS
jgi:hypothetical protein